VNRLAAMEVFVRVIAVGSFSTVVRQLGVRQPAVSKTVAQLEDRLGVRLLLRSTRAPFLAAWGKNALFFRRLARSIQARHTLPMSSSLTPATSHSRCTPAEKQQQSGDFLLR
jgi:DNA-binding transcriptional LysR family regulator